MSRYVVAVKRSRRASGATALRALEVPGVSLKGGDCLRAVIEASEASAAEIIRLFKDDLIVEQEIAHKPS